MIKVILVITLLMSSLMAKKFNFSEVRYSNAFDTSVELKGEIIFDTNSLFIKYESSTKTILYKDFELTFKQDGTVLELDEIQKQRISSYFKVILLLYSNDEKLLSEKFEVKKDANRVVLIPKENMRSYVRKIILTKVINELKVIELYFTNSDKITIRLEDEIR